MNSRSDLINYLISKYNFSSYLEIGLDNPDNNYNKINCKYKESVDPYLKDTMDLVKDPPKELTYYMTSDRMFSLMDKDKKFDIVFIDGLHEQYQVYRDFINSLNHLNKGGYIIMHDCKPYAEQYACFPRISNGPWFGTTWKVVPMLKNLHDIFINVLDMDCGCGIYKKEDDKLYEIKESYLDYSFSDYDKLVNVVSVKNYFG